VVRIIHAEGDEGGLILLAAAVDEDLDDVTSIEDELAKGVGLLAVALFDPVVVFFQRQASIIAWVSGWRAA
jgi:hypothetical protein